MNKTIALILRSIVLILLQVIILNNINFLGYINPQLYILALLLFPFGSNKSVYLIYAFFLGLTLDMFGDSGGVHTAACLTVAYVRSFVLQFSFGVSYEYNNIKLNDVSLSERLIYITTLTLIHHLVLFSLEVFSANEIVYILQKTVITGCLTIVLSLCSIIIFSRPK